MKLGAKGGGKAASSSMLGAVMAEDGLEAVAGAVSPRSSAAGGSAAAVVAAAGAAGTCARVYLLVCVCVCAVPCAEAGACVD
jgi:hypothetical protein